MDRENRTPESLMKSGAEKTATSNIKVGMSGSMNDNNRDDDDEEWKEGYLAEIYLSGNLKNQP